MPLSIRVKIKPPPVSYSGTKRSYSWMDTHNNRKGVCTAKDWWTREEYAL
jgi:hypothetical protein